MSDQPTIPIESPGVAVIVVRKHEDGWQVLLLKRAQHTRSGGHWGLVSGMKEKSETGTEIAIRELKEETGLSPVSVFATEHLMQFYYAPKDVIWIFPIFVAVIDSNSPIKLCNEHTEFGWFFPYQAKQVVTWKNMATAIELVASELSCFPAKNWTGVA